MKVTASVLYDLAVCPRRVALDAFGDVARQDETNAFVRLLWERGARFEWQTIAALGDPFVDLSNTAEIDRQRLTLEAMGQGAPMIYGGRISAADLLGMPDLLRKEPGGYVPGDIKSGRGKERGGDGRDGKPKLSYAVQLACYVDILERLGRSAGRRAFVLDVRGDRVEYDFTSHAAGRDLWGDYLNTLAAARSILARRTVPLPAYGGVCKLCHWYSCCLDELTDADDLTLIADLRRSDRDAMHERIPSIAAFAAIDPDVFTRGKKSVFRGIGAERFRALQARAVLLNVNRPVNLALTHIR